jgi:hypothetical protein
VPPLDSLKDARPPAPALNERLPAEKLEDLEHRLSADYGLEVHLADLIAPPITEEKLRTFLLGNGHKIEAGA